MAARKKEPTPEDREKAVWDAISALQERHKCHVYAVPGRVEMTQSGIEMRHPPMVAVTAHDEEGEKK